MCFMLGSMAHNGERRVAMQIIDLIRSQRSRSWRNTVHAIEALFHLGHRCPRCTLYKPTEEFYTSPTRPSGVAGYCIQCVAEYHQESTKTRKQRAARAQTIRR